MKSPKIQVNIGIPYRQDRCNGDIDVFERMIEICSISGVNVICDMSSHLDHIEERRNIIQASGIPWCSVPIYEYYLRYSKEHDHKIMIEPFLKILDQVIEKGARYLLLHSAFNKTVYDYIEGSKRLVKIASRGGGIHWRHFFCSARENPLYEHFDLILDRLHSSNTALFLGAATRPGSICDGLDGPFMQEMLVQAELVREAIARKVEVIVEGVGHTTVPDLIKWVKLARSLFGPVALKPLPISTDIGAAIDNVSHAISVYHCARMGVEYICCISPAEHLGSPSLEDIQIAIGSARLAMHAAALPTDTQAMKADYAISMARAKNDWAALFANALDPDLARRKFRELNEKSSAKGCTMCNELCPKIIMELKDEGGTH